MNYSSLLYIFFTPPGLTFFFINFSESCISNLAQAKLYSNSLFRYAISSYEAIKYFSRLLK